MSFHSTIEILGIMTDVCFRSDYTQGEETFSCTFQIDQETFDLQFKKNANGSFFIDSVYSALFTYSMDEFNAALAQIEADNDFPLTMYGVLQ